MKFVDLPKSDVIECTYDRAKIASALEIALERTGAAVYTRFFFVDTEGKHPTCILFLTDEEPVKNTKALHAASRTPKSLSSMLESLIGVPILDGKGTRYPPPPNIRARQAWNIRSFLSSKGAHVGAIVTAAWA